MFYILFLCKQSRYLSGLILASIPSLIKDINTKQDFQPKYLLFTLFSLLFGIILVLLENKISFETTNNVNYIYLIICGFIMSIGIIVPGVSSTILLMLLGIYPVYLASVSSVYLPILFPLGIGVILGSLFFMKLTRFLLDKFYAQTFYSIIGFTAGSIFVLIPEMSFNIDFVIFVLCVILGFLLFNLTNKKTL